MNTLHRNLRFKNFFDQKEQAEAVRLTAERNGFTTLVYKGWTPHNTVSNPRGFPTFDKNDDELIYGVVGFFALDPNIADKFRVGPRTALDAFYLRIDKPKTMDAGGGHSGTLQFGESGREFRDAVRSKQFDAILINNTKDEGDIIVMLDSFKIKLASPVTTDNNGNIIPIEQRFDVTKKDIRY